MSKRIVLVGHCGIDGPRLQQELSSALAEAEVVRVNSDEELKRACDEGANLLLVNREPVGFDPTSGSGIDLIKQVKTERPHQKAMLVSDFPDAQEEAVAAGALPGFGKADIGSPKLMRTVEQALAG